MIQKDVDSIVTYFDVANELEAVNILDVGMFLKRAGCLSRMALGRRLDEDVKLTGVDILPKVQLPAWNHVYDSVLDVESFLKSEDDIYYDLAFLLGAPGIMQHIPWKELTSKLAKCAKIVVSDCMLEDWTELFEGKSLQSDGKQYFLFQAKGRKNGH